MIRDRTVDKLAICYGEAIRSYVKWQNSPIWDRPESKRNVEIGISNCYRVINSDKFDRRFENIGLNLKGMVADMNFNKKFESVVQ